VENFVAFRAKMNVSLKCCCNLSGSLNSIGSLCGDACSKRDHSVLNNDMIGDSATAAADCNTPD